MAQPTCPKCDNKMFEVQTAEPQKSRYKVWFVNCTKCGAVVGVLDYWNIGALVLDLGKRLGFDLSKDR